MNFLIVFICTIGLVLIFRKSFKKHSMVFYSAAILLTILYAANVYITYPALVRNVLFLLMQKCTLSLALFAIVMFVGVFPRGSKIGQAFRPIRTELSITACILCLGHVFIYLRAFAPRFFGGSLPDVETLAFMIAVFVLAVLLVILGVTSLPVLKHKMNPAVWKKVQRMSYLFFGLVYLHMLIILLPSALDQSAIALSNVAVYTVLFGAYAVLRIRRAVLDKRVACSGE